MSDNSNSTAQSGDLSSDIRHAVGRLYRRFRSEREDGELGDAATSVLGRLHRIGPQSLKELSDHARVTPGSMSQTVNRLTSSGLAVRTPDSEDGRRVLFIITDDGREVATRTIASSIAWFDGELAKFSAEELETLRQAAALLNRISASDATRH
jgi:DNA-binding MarR family transcriptional regulator